MISVQESERDVLRFLWINDIHAQPPPVEIYRFGRVVFGVSCSPFLLNATLKKHIESYMEECPEIVNILINSLYVDDVNSGGHTVNEVLNLYEKSKSMMQSGGFNLRKWHSNSNEVMHEIKQRERVIVEIRKAFLKTMNHMLKLQPRKTVSSSLLITRSLV